MIKTIKTYMKARRTYNELDRLSDRELRDLGINRSDIIKIAFDLA